MDNPRTGTWQYDAMTAASVWASDNPDIILFIGIGLVLCGMALAIRYLWRRWLRIGTTKVYYKVLKNPVRWLLRPINRYHRRCSDRNLGIKMAKWRKGHLANAFYEAIHMEIEEGRLSRQHVQRLAGEPTNRSPRERTRPVLSGAQSAGAVRRRARHRLLHPNRQLVRERGDPALGRPQAYGLPM